MAKPLTKKRLSDGTPYFRASRVEANIDGAIEQPLDVLQRRLHVKSETEPDYLASECLVHLLRQAIEHDDQPRTTAVYEALIRRVERTLRYRLQDLSPLVSEQVRFDVLFALNELFSRRSNQLDFYEVRFNKALKTLYLNKLPPEEPETVVEFDEQLIHDDDEPTMQELSASSKDFSAALDALPTVEREALLLVEMTGYKIESQDPHEETAATICRVSGRTIRTRLLNAKHKLKALLKDHDS